MEVQYTLTLRSTHSETRFICYMLYGYLQDHVYVGQLCIDEHHRKQWHQQICTNRIATPCIKKDRNCVKKQERKYTLRQLVNITEIDTQTTESMK